MSSAADPTNIPDLGGPQGLAADRPTADHGAAGFCTGHGLSVDRPTREALDAILARAALARFASDEDPLTPVEVDALLAARDAEVEREARRADIAERDLAHMVGRAQHHLDRANAAEATVDDLARRWQDAEDRLALAHRVGDETGQALAALREAVEAVPPSPGAVVGSNTITIRLTPTLAERVAAELTERAREARAAEEGR